ncbi:YhjD/YihY/BrkB family envelope integrity protein [Desertihabitans aurantiacus]|uniref:YhjD/YihY/BrkB family envelope integrity protein n=1 Tax=Desertihabitans aurantiacus TaxID=2282477 RepID=UPI000DF74339|nr:YhjD/YihY/BrkB family envelope integrity protein [Desertihabitans aurantiacus]
MGELLKKITSQPWVAHLLRANARFDARMGNAFAGAITYFSVLALVPVVAVAFGLVGLLFADELRTGLDDVLSAFGPQLTDTLQPVLEEGLEGAGAIVGVGGATALYAGANWVAQLKSAVRAQWRPRFDDPEHRRMIVLETAVNIAILIGLIALVTGTVALSSVATWLADTVLGWLALDGVPGITVLLRLVPLLGSLLLGLALFAFLFSVLPQTRVRTPAVLKGCVMGTVGLAALTYLSSTIVGLFTENAAFTVFGPVILLMLFLNLFARLILFLAAWVATSEQRAVAGERSAADAPLEADPEVDLEPAVEPMPEPAHAAPGGRGRNPYAARVDWARRERVQIGPEQLDVSYPSEDVKVPQTVAVRSSRIASAVGWVFGAASGIGLGSLVASRLGRRRR